LDTFLPYSITDGMASSQDWKLQKTDARKTGLRMSEERNENAKTVCGTREKRMEEKYFS
jgi:hypothetical protein